MDNHYHDIDRRVDTLAFSTNELLINGIKAGSYEIDEKNRGLSFEIVEGAHPPFALFKVDDRYYYRYHFNKSTGQLFLVPLDEKEEHQRISVEGQTLLFDKLEKLN